MDYDMTPYKIVKLYNDCEEYNKLVIRFDGEDRGLTGEVIIDNNYLIHNDLNKRCYYDLDYISAYVLYSE